MGVLEELPDDSGACSNCGKVALTKCTGCKQVISPMCSEDVLKINVRTVKGAQASMRYSSLSFFYSIQAWRLRKYTKNVKIFWLGLIFASHIVFLLAYETCTLTNCNHTRLIY
jgi:hypothetical protein